MRPELLLVLIRYKLTLGAPLPVLAFQATAGNRQELA